MSVREDRINTTKDFQNSYVYDHQNRMTRLTQGAQGGGNAVADKRIGFTYNDLSQFDTITRYASSDTSELVATTTFSYDGFNRLSSLQHTKGVTALAGYDYTYDLANRITSIDSLTDGLSSYDYDDTNQLTGADHASQDDEAYEYDDNGNRIMSGYDIDPNNQIASDGTYDYEYDAEGNRTAKVADNGDRIEYTWDYRNRLTLVTFLDDEEHMLKTVTYTYDVFNRLVGVELDSNGETSGGISNRYLIHDGNQIVLEFDGSSATDVSHRYLWGPQTDQIVSDEQVTTVASAGTVVWPLTDHLGTARDLALHNSTTHVTTIDNHRIYDSFGNLTDETPAAVTTDIQWTGRWFDIRTGLQWNDNRWYDPNVGQWLSEDPIGFDGGDYNVRAYVNDPLTSTDPTGLSSFLKTGTAAATNRPTVGVIVAEGTNQAHHILPNARPIDDPNPARPSGPLASWMWDTAQYYRGTPGEIIPGMLVGPSMLVDGSMFAEVHNAAEDAREQIRDQIESSDSSIDKFVGQAALLLTYGGEGFAQHGVSQAGRVICPIPDLNIDGDTNDYRKHRKKTPSKLPKHQKGDARRKRDAGGEKGDINRDPPRKRPPGWKKGPWPPLE